MYSSIVTRAACIPVPRFLRLWLRVFQSHLYHVTLGWCAGLGSTGATLAGGIKEAGSLDCSGYSDGKNFSPRGQLLDAPCLGCVGVNQVAQGGKETLTL